MKTFCFTIDDNIRFLKELCEGASHSLFDHPYTAMLKRLHEGYGIKIQLNLFYRVRDFTLSDMTDKFRGEWNEAADWLKLSFHSYEESVRPYQSADYETVRRDAERVTREILRFAGPHSLAKTTTVHYCDTTEDGRRALADGGIIGLLGLYGDEKSKLTSYSLDEKSAEAVRGGGIIEVGGIAHAKIDLIVNKLSLGDIAPALALLASRECIRIMIHEQYFYPDYPAYQPDFEDKLAIAFGILHNGEYKSVFFEDLLHRLNPESERYPPS